MGTWLERYQPFCCVFGDVEVFQNARVMFRVALWLIKQETGRHISPCQICLVKLYTLYPEAIES